ncbi:hypothetical protein KBI23_01265 [bacterium]|nr:hypothetical protein [bacterium]MBP9808864.1 hypothetical protein [bacterium]
MNHLQDAQQLAIALIPKINAQLVQVVELLVPGDYSAVPKLSRTHKPPAEELAAEVNSYRLKVGQLPDEVFSRIAVLSANEDFDVVGGRRCECANKPLPLELYLRLGNDDQYFITVECSLYDMQGEKSDLVLFLEYRDPGRNPFIPDTIYRGSG